MGQNTLMKPNVIFLTIVYGLPIFDLLYMNVYCVSLISAAAHMNAHVNAYLYTPYYSKPHVTATCTAASHHISDNNLVLFTQAVFLMTP